ncbi:FMR1-interacting protein NUFIP1 [Musca vetustissima]|uniref:FMR1-interacting protein NUFIP1 n=1 Tax=Musca vetustissima TaxID=27455 RepID=UPI002AB5F5A1|nr:FMR1-interacting protein NUFIP1 [Musca vetustissima]
MEPPTKFLLPSPNFNNNKQKECPSKPKPHYLTPSGMTILPREKQPPPMYGKRGATVPPRFLKPPNANTPPAESTRQYCEPCEMELASMEDLKHHRAQHEKCPVDGCQYRGHITVMDKHVTALHSSGLFDKFKKLNTPEEIAAWREERRKRYPTVENVLLKQKAQEQRQKRGERLEASKCRFGKQDDRKRALPPNANDSSPKDSGDGIKRPAEPDGGGKQQKGQANKRNKKKRKNQRDCKDNTKKAEHVNATKEEEKTSDDEDDCKFMVRFQGTRGMKDYKHCEKKVKEKNTNVLFSLVGMYGSDDDEEEEEEEEEGRDNKQQDKCNGDFNKLENTNSKEKEIHTQSDSPLDGNKQSNMNEQDQRCNDRGEKDATDNDTVPTDKNTGKNNFILNPHEGETAMEQRTEDIEPLPIEEEENIQKSSSQSFPNGNSSDEGPEEIPIEHQLTEYKFENVQQEKTTAVQPPAPPKKCPAAKQNEVNNRPQKPTVKRKSGLDYRKAKLRKQNSMLEKLLETDIRHERNVLLQCVRYVCENNFFGIGKSKIN